MKHRASSTHRMSVSLVRVLDGVWCNRKRRCYVAAICEPPCLNGGHCVRPGRCLCPRGFAQPDCSRTYVYEHFVNRCPHPVIKVRGNAGERRSWASKKCRGAFLGHTQSNILGVPPDATVYSACWCSVYQRTQTHLAMYTNLVPLALNCRPTFCISAYLI